MKALYSNGLQAHTTTDLPLYNDRFTLIQRQIYPYTTTDLPYITTIKINVVVSINAFIIYCRFIAEK